MTMRPKAPGGGSDDGDDQVGIATENPHPAQKTEHVQSFDAE